MNIKKYSGCGNTFSIVRFEDLKDDNFEQLAQKICNDDKIQTDGLIVVKQSPLEMIFYNRDGTPSSMCGNGIRCFVKYCYDEELIDKEMTEFDVLTGTGILRIDRTRFDPFFCRVAMGKAEDSPEKLGMPPRASLTNTFTFDGEQVTAHSIFVGTIHTVVFVDHAEAMAPSWAKDLHEHPMFAKKTNVNVVYVQDENTLRVNTYERGVGFTQACGTGCCASAYTAWKQGLTGASVKTIVPGGELTIDLLEAAILMTGPAIYEKEVTL